MAESVNDALYRTYKQGTKGAPTAVSVTASATLVLSANAFRKTAVIANNGTNTVFVGRDNTVTASTGFPIFASTALTDVETGDAWWGIVATGTGDVRVVEVT